MSSYPPPPPPYTPHPITMPPVSQQSGRPACVRGLEVLMGIDHLRIQQQVEMGEAFTGFEMANRYRILTNTGQNVFYAVEDSDPCGRQCGGSSRDITMRLLDQSGYEILTMHRPFYMECMCSTPLTPQELTVWSAADNSVLGYVTQDFSMNASFRVFNGAREQVLHIDGPSIRYGTVPFDILSVDRQFKVGRILKEHAGIMRELFTDADHFEITFPMDLDTNIKAVLLGALFVIDYTYFERP